MFMLDSMSVPKQRNLCPLEYKTQLSILIAEPIMQISPNTKWNLFEVDKSFSKMGEKDVHWFYGTFKLW